MLFLQKGSQVQSRILSPLTRLTGVAGVTPGIILREKVTVKVPYPELDIYAEKALKQNKGKIYDKKPFKFYCEKGKTYLWCTCGWSHNQPFCDNHHKNPHFRIKLKPLVFRCTESGDYWFCNCKQTDKRPFCDGSHRNPTVQEAIR